MDCNVAVHLYTWRLTPHCDDDLALLSTEEKHRYITYKHALSATRYVAARAGLRRRLGAYLNINPASLQIDHTPLGKPFLRHLFHCHFSLSHCADNAVLVVAEVPVGVDLEALPVQDWKGLAQHILSTDEHDHLHSCASEEQAHFLIKYWTAKESIVKACGLGLQLPVQLIEINHDFRQPILPPDVINLIGDEWKIEVSDYGVDRILAVCVQCPPSQRYTIISRDI